MIDDILLAGQKAAKKPKKEEPKAEAAPAETPAQDELKKINGVGPAFEKALNEHGIHTYQQIIDLSAEEIEKLAEEVDGVTVEMVQDDWIPQAKELNA